MDVDHRAGPLKISDLKYTYHPELPIPDDLMKLKVPDSADLRRNDWFEMLYFVNKFANTNGLGSLGVAKHAEKLIQEKVPKNLRSHEQIRKWLLDNWKYFS